jgi:histone-lysine N-methyltransferase SETD2
MTMTEVYSLLKQETSQILSMSLDPKLNGVDLSAPARGKEEPSTATSSPTITISTAMDIQSDPYVKIEGNDSPSQSPTVVTDVSAQNFKLSPSPTPSTTDAAAESESSSPPLATPYKTPRKGSKLPVQLISDLSIAREAAVSSFTEIYDNNYQYKSLGRSREVLESMTCDCTYEHGSSSFPLRFGSFL